MAAVAAQKKVGVEEPQPEGGFHRIRITLSSRNVKNLEKGPYFVTKAIVSCHYTTMLRFGLVIASFFVHVNNNSHHRWWPIYLTAVILYRFSLR
jgi:NO-binding membrane sensor protein with MHYT domain